MDFDGGFHSVGKSAFRVDGRWIMVRITTIKGAAGDGIVVASLQHGIRERDVCYRVTDSETNERIVGGLVEEAGFELELSSSSWKTWGKSGVRLPGNETVKISARSKTKRLEVNIYILTWRSFRFVLCVIVRLALRHDS